MWGLITLHWPGRPEHCPGEKRQRIRLATQIGSGLVGVAYILDEPSIGLHQRDNDKLLATLKHLRDLGNSLIVVEHDEGYHDGGRLYCRYRAGRRMSTAGKLLPWEQLRI